MRNSWAFSGAPRNDRDASEERASGVRLRLTEHYVEFIVIRHDGTEYGRYPDMTAALRPMLRLGNGAATIAPDGTLLRYMADAVNQRDGEKMARRAVARWLEST